MPTDPLDDLATAAARRQRALWGIHLGAGLVIAWLIVQFGGLGLAAGAVLTLALLLDVFTVSGTVVYETPKSAAEVRAEFIGPAPPLFALLRRNVDQVTDLERGFAWQHSGWIRTTSGRIEAAETDGPLELRIVESDELVRTVTVSVEPHGSVTRVIATMEREANVVFLLLARLLDPLQRQVMATQGYVRVSDETSVF